MPHLTQTIEQLRETHQRELSSLHDDYAHTLKLWRLLQVRVRRYGERVTFHNPHTGNRVDEANLASQAAVSLRRLHERSFKDVIARFELFVSDLMRRWLAEHPELVEAKALNVGTLLRAASLAEAQQAAIAEAVEETILKKAYGPPQKWFNYLHERFGDVATSGREVAEFLEMKATRDVLEHAGGIANDVYVEKAGALARVSSGHPLNIDESYLTSAFTLVRRLVDTYTNAAIKVATRA